MAEEYSYEIRIPQERIGVLIGVKGSVKSEIQKLTNTKIRVDAEEGNITLTGSDPVLLFNAKETVRAIGRGFNPEIARQLLRQDYLLEIMNLDTDKKAQLDRIRGRIIGEKGKARKIIEDLTETSISVYGKTIGIIGEYDTVAFARRAIESLIAGSTHSHVYRWLEKQRRVRKQRAIAESF
ncbi:RNA-processing protein [Candidatus Woesearchaeota archaeon]|nr:RNA-processing protein [Candidatus Woesearchaeota archaeon]